MCAPELCLMGLGLQGKNMRPLEPEILKKFQEKLEMGVFMHSLSEFLNVGNKVGVFTVNMITM